MRDLKALLQRISFEKDENKRAEALRFILKNRDLWKEEKVEEKLFSDLSLYEKQLLGLMEV